MAKSLLALHEDMGPAILERLSEFTPLPKSGVVAGQSVASAVSELFGDGRAVVYNDVDVFRQQTTEEFNRIMSKLKNEEVELKPKALKTCEFSIANFVDEYRFIGIESRSRYRVLNTRRIDMLNEVQCAFHDTNPIHFLETFDMNCVQAGINLETGKLFWTPGFEKFCGTRQLEITKLHTPPHTLIRYLKKRQELEGVFGNDERMLEMVTAACAYTDPTEHRHSGFSMGFGEKFREKLLVVENQITPYFDVCETMVADYRIFYLKPKHEADKRLAVNSNVDLVHLLPVRSRALHEKYAPAKSDRLKYLAEEASSKSYTLASLARLGTDYVQGNVTPAQMKMMDKTVEEHHISAWIAAPTLGGQWDKFSFIRQQAQQRGLWVYGVLENQRFPKDTSAEYLIPYLDEQAHLLSLSLKKKTLPDFVIDGVCYSELVTGMELVEEGSALHHCVAGYAEAVKEKRSRIISVRPVGTDHARHWVTVELQKYERKPWCLAQARGLANRGINDMEADAVQMYLHLTNLEHALPRFLALPMIRFMPNTASKAGKAIAALMNKSVRNLNMNYLSNALANKLKLPYMYHDRDTGGRYHRRHILNYWIMAYKTRHERREEARFAKEAPSATQPVPSMREDTDEIPF